MLDLEIDGKDYLSKEWLHLCIVTIENIYSNLLNNHEYNIQKEDLGDYADALLEIRRSWDFFNRSNMSHLYPCGKLIIILDEAKRHLTGALGINNLYSPNRTKYIQYFRTSLGKILEQIDGFGSLPP